MKKLMIIFWAICHIFIISGCAPQSARQSVSNGEVSNVIYIEIPREPGNKETGTEKLPEGFIYLTDVMPDVILEIRYYSTYNFIGTRIDGYLAPAAIITREAAEALSRASIELKAKGYIIKIFDAYRPHGAVEHFIRWAKDTDDTLMKEYFYPDLEKDRLFPERYLGVRSAHSRGSTFDLTIVSMKTGMEADMGSPYDFFGPVSHHGSKLVTKEQEDSRLILKTAMENAGFRAYPQEWWHYTLNNEPYPATYFSFPVK